MLDAGSSDQSSTQPGYPMLCSSKIKTANGESVSTSQASTNCPNDDFPLQRISTIIDSVIGWELLSLLDCFIGYHQITINQQDKEKTNFITPFGTYYFRRMPEELRNAGSTFARMTVEVFKEDKTISAYVDDIVV